MSHTPIPWKARATNPPQAIISPHVSFAQGYLVCRVNRTFYDEHGHEMSLPPEQVESNARLIEAAPALLEACKAVLAALESAALEGRVLWINPPYQSPAVHESAQERLEDVIEKATGEPLPEE